MTGGKDGKYSENRYGTVLSYNITSREWDHIGNMIHNRSDHAISLVPAVDIVDHCQEENTDGHL